MKVGLEELHTKVMMYQQRTEAKADNSKNPNPSYLNFKGTQAADSITSPFGVSDHEATFRDQLTERNKVRPNSEHSIRI